VSAGFTVAISARVRSLKMPAPGAQGGEELRIALEIRPGTVAPASPGRPAGVPGPVGVTLRQASLHPSLPAVDRAHGVGLAQSDERPALVRVLAQQAVEDQLVDQAPPGARRQLGAHPEGAQARLEGRGLAGLAEEVLHQPAATIPPVQTVGGGQDLLRLEGQVLGLRRTQTVIAAPAVRHALLAEIAAHRRRAAGAPVQQGVELSHLARLHRPHLVGEGLSLQPA